MPDKFRKGTPREGTETILNPSISKIIIHIEKEDPERGRKLIKHWTGFLIPYLEKEPHFYTNFLKTQKSSFKQSERYRCFLNFAKMPRSISYISFIDC